MKAALWVLLGVVIVIGGWFVWASWTHFSSSMGDRHMDGGREHHMRSGRPILGELRIPALNEQEMSGKSAFDGNCAACHGENAAGVGGVGPPLVHKIYEPGHHGDGAFVVAARNGVRAHHWQFGNMPPVRGITDQELFDIIAYVRKMQRANGIF